MVKKSKPEIKRRSPGKVTVPSIASELEDKLKYSARTLERKFSNFIIICDHTVSEHVVLYPALIGLEQTTH